MNFLRLPDPLLSVLFEDDDIIAIDKPYGFNAHTNDSKLEHSDFTEDGLIEIYEKQRGEKLHIIHRLDQTTTGVMIFGRSALAAKKYAEYFLSRQVKKTYWFITQFRSNQKSITINSIIIHKAKELDAETDFSFIKKSANYELWQANPHTGRNHQIRIHAQEAGISILGDPKYNGHPFYFLCLHNCQIEFPNGIIIKSTPPAYFKDLSLLENRLSSHLFFEADRRMRLFGSTSSQACFRMGHLDDELTVEQYGPSAFLSLEKKALNPEEEKKLLLFEKYCQKNFIITPVPSELKATEWLVHEGSLKLELRCQKNSVHGLPLCQRLQRLWVQKNSKDKTVLHLFSQSGAFSLAAYLGEARDITQVDLSKSNLNWAKKNFELNHFKIDKVFFLNRDSSLYIDQCASKNKKFDLIVCEAPSFYHREKGVFKIEDQLDTLIESCLQCLNPQGQLLFSVSNKELTIDRIKKAFLNAQQRLSLDSMTLNSILPSLDFELPGQRTLLKSFLIQI